MEPGSADLAHFIKELEINVKSILGYKL